MARTVNAIRRPQRCGDPGVIRIDEDCESVYYLVREIGSAIGGRGWVVWRLTAVNPYSVRIGPGSDESCDCVGFSSGVRCRHVLAMRALIAKGEL
jgi:hypothetical protein